MLILDAKAFITVIHGMIALEASFKNVEGDIIDPSTKDEWLDSICGGFENLDLRVTSRLSRNLIGQANTFKDLSVSIASVYATMASEMEGKKFYAPIGRLEKYFQPDMLFGQDVFDKFPSAANDIFEAGTCLALDRSTACVMHSMRVAEVGLTSLAGAMDVTKQNDWGSYLREIEKELTRRMKESGVRTENERFFAEAHTVFDGMRRAWRNPTMHVENTYSSERAEEIMLAVKSFMRHLATKISE